MSVAVPQSFERIPVLGVGVDRVTMAEALDKIDEFIRSRRPHHVITLDASMCVMASEDADLERIVRAAELSTPDSVGVLWACKRMGKPLPERVSGVEIVERLCSLSPHTGYRLFFFGAAPGIAEAAGQKLAERFPGCQIVGTRNGFFTPDDEPDIIAQVREAKPDVLCVALGIPKQEKWIDRHKEELGVPVLIGVGGTFDVHSGTVKRAPVIFQKLCLEWLYRLLKNPKKIGKVMTLPRFVLMNLSRR